MKYSKASMKRLKTCHEDLQTLFDYVLALGLLDITIVDGRRGKVRQTLYYTKNRSKVKYPNSKHNKKPSMAVDAVPCINGKASWKKVHCCVLAGMVLAVAEIIDIKIRWGGNWDMDAEPITDQRFQDLGHYELVE